MLYPLWGKFLCTECCKHLFCLKVPSLYLIILHCAHLHLASTTHKLLQDFVRHFIVSQISQIFVFWSTNNTAEATISFLIKFICIRASRLPSGQLCSCSCTTYYTSLTSVDVCESVFFPFFLQLHSSFIIVSLYAVV